MQDAENTSPGKQSLWRIPEFRFGVLFFLWIFLVLFTFLIQSYPALPQSILPSALHDDWEEFAVMKLGMQLRMTNLICGTLTLLSLFTGGWKIQSRVGMFLAWFFFALLLTGMTLPSLGSVTERGLRIGCSCNIMELARALSQYADNHDGWFPPNLETLEPQISQDQSSENIFRCPSKRPPGNEFSDYLYFGAGRKLKDAPFLLLQDRDKNHPGVYWNSLYSNGRFKEGPKAH